MFSSVFGQGSIYEQLDDDDGKQQQTNNLFHGRAHPATLPSLASDDEEEEDIEAQAGAGQHGVGPSDRFVDRYSDDEDNNEVPKSVLVEEPLLRSSKPVRRSKFDTRTARREQQQRPQKQPSASEYRVGRPGLDPVEKARWKWANVENLDNFFADVYSYFLGSGFYTIMLSRVLNLATLVFVVSFSTYITSCIDYSKIPGSTQLSDIQKPRCMANIGYFHSFILWIFALFCFMKAFQYAMDVRRLIDMKNFYEYLLEIPESDMQTVSWQHVVNRLVLLKDQNLVTATKSRRINSQSRQRMDFCDIANRIMRQENYLIAMINKDVLDLSIPLPGLRNRQFLTKTMEWHLSLCIMDFAFNDQGQLRPVFLKETHRSLLAEGLRRRFIFAGIMNIVVAPFGIIYLTLLYFFQYYGEYHKNPSSIGSRQYTPLAEWKFREFNELSHLFRRRMRHSYEPASRYINQFPKEKTASGARFVSFVAGSFAAVLGIISLLGPEQFLGFEITPDRTVLFYIGIFTTILALSRGMIPEETLVFDPEPAIRQVAEHTHFMPKEWEGRLHSDWVKSEFSELYQYKIAIILRELASVVVAPFVLWLSLPKSSEKIVDFFRDFSVHVDGLGYVCSFAVFNFDKPAKTDLRETYFTTTEGKMLKSYLNFVDNYGMQQQQEIVPPSKGKKKVKPAADDNYDMENSVMGRFNRLYNGKNEYIEPNQRDSVLFPNEPGYETGLNSEPSQGGLSSPRPEDGGVLGLLNQFYKQAGTGDDHKV